MPFSSSDSITLAASVGAHTGSSIRLFAYDCLLYRVIQDAGDAQAPQNDLAQMCSWATDWQMLFNADICSVLIITHKQSRPEIWLHHWGQVAPTCDPPPIPWYGTHRWPKLGASHQPDGVKVPEDPKPSPTQFVWMFTKHQRACLWDTCATITGVCKLCLGPLSDQPHPPSRGCVVCDAKICGKPVWQPTWMISIEGCYRSTASLPSSPCLTRQYMDKQPVWYHHTFPNVALVLLPPHWPRTQKSHEHQFSLPTQCIDTNKYSFYPRTIRIWNILTNSYSGLWQGSFLRCSLNSSSYPEQCMSSLPGANTSDHDWEALAARQQWAQPTERTENVYKGMHPYFKFLRIQASDYPFWLILDVWTHMSDLLFLDSFSVFIPAPDLHPAPE